MAFSPAQPTPSLSVFDEACISGAALALRDDASYDTVIDSALFHIFDAGDRTRYAHSLHRVLRPGGLVHVLALADTGRRFGPQVSDAAIRDAFGHGWLMEDLRPAQYRGVVARDEHAVALNRRLGELVDLPAWLARARRMGPR